MDLWKAVQETLKDYYDTFGRLDMASGKASGIFPDILARAEKDIRFRKKILDDPAGTLAREGFRLPEGFHLKFVEELDDVLYLPLLPFAGEGFSIRNEGGTNKLDELLQTAVTDRGFREKLVEDPLKVVSEAGFTMDPARSIVILECTDDLFYAVLPRMASDNGGQHSRARLEIGDNTIRLSGRLDAGGADHIRDTLLNMEGNLILDLENLDYISSAGLSLLLMRLKKTQASGCTLKMINLKPAVKNVFVLAGFDRIFNV